MTRSFIADDAQALHAVTVLSCAGANIVELRAGNGEPPLFLLPGLTGQADELRDLAQALGGAYAIHALTLEAADDQGRAIDNVAHMAALLVSAIRRVQPNGPYRLGGYSFGALIALEMAQQLRVEGQAIEALFLIEAVFDERYWPRAIWLRALANRSARQMKRIAGMPPRRALGEFRMRAGRLAQRFARRGKDAPDGLRAVEADARATLGHARKAIGVYRPAYYDGTMMLIASTRDRHFGCDTPELWTGLARRIEVRRVNGDHLTIIRNPASVAAIAGLIDHRIALGKPEWAGLKPEPGFARPMIVSTMRWFSTARLVHALMEAGFAVSACRLNGHAIGDVEGLAYDGRLNRLRPLESLRDAIREAGPDMLLPDDERAIVLLRRLHDWVHDDDPALAALIETSIGRSAYWDAMKSRAAVAAEALALGAVSPETVVIDGPEALKTWAARQALPLVLKTDGSWGGRGVAVIGDARRIGSAWWKISSPPSFVRGIKRLLIDREYHAFSAWLFRMRPVVNAQAHVEGRQAIATASCRDGVITRLVCLDVVQSMEGGGPATVVRAIDHPGMAETARLLIKRFGLNGFCGFDFLIDAEGAAHLIEWNPRVTPTCHMLIENDVTLGQTVALFPQGLIRDGADIAAVSGVLDIPTRAPALVQHAQAIVRRRNNPLVSAWRRRRAQGAVILR